MTYFRSQSSIVLILCQASANFHDFLQHQTLFVLSIYTQNIIQIFCLVSIVYIQLMHQFEKHVAFDDLHFLFFRVCLYNLLIRVSYQEFLNLIVLLIAVVEKTFQDENGLRRKLAILHMLLILRGSIDSSELREVSQKCVKMQHRAVVDSSKGCCLLGSHWGNVGIVFYDSLQSGQRDDLLKSLVRITCFSVKNTFSQPYPWLLI